MQASNENSLTRREIRSLVAWVVAGALGVACFALLNGRGPKSSVAVTVGPSEAEALSRDFVEDLGYSTEGYRHGLVFMRFQEPKRFLESELGLEAADAMMRDEVDVWVWSSQWWEEESFRVRIAPGGRLVSFRHTVPEVVDVESLQPQEALARAETFIREHTDLDLNGYRLLESDPNEQPNRTDHEFRWEKLEFDAHGATLRAQVTVRGDEISLYRQYLELPEEWDQSESRDDRTRLILTLAAVAGGLGLYVAAIAVFIVFMRRGRLRFGFAILLGFVLFYIWWFGRDSGLSPDMLHGLFMVMIVGTAGDALGRQVFPRRPPISDCMKRSFWTSKEVFMASVVGCSFAFLFLASVVLFQGAYSVIDPGPSIAAPFHYFQGSPTAWLEPMADGLIPAIQEELVFRLFTVSLLIYLFKRPWIAVAIPAVLWGFVHSYLAGDSVYLLGIAFSVVGVAFGFVYVRYGIVATIIAHYAYNATLSVIPMIQGGDAYARWSAVAVIGLMFVPAIPGARIILGRKNFTRYTAEVAGGNAASSGELNR